MKNKSIRNAWFAYFLINLVILEYANISELQCGQWYCEPQEHIENSVNINDLLIRSDNIANVSASGSGVSGYSGEIILLPKEKQ